MIKIVRTFHLLVNGENTGICIHLIIDILFSYDLIK